MALKWCIQEYENVAALLSTVVFFSYLLESHQNIDFFNAPVPICTHIQKPVPLTPLLDIELRNPGLRRQEPSVCLTLTPEPPASGLVWLRLSQSFGGR